MHVLGTPPALILSQDQTLMLKGFPSARPRGLAQENPVTRAPVDLALSRCSVRQVNRWFTARTQARTDDLSTNHAAPPADTRRVSPSRLTALGRTVLARSIQFSKNRLVPGHHITRRRKPVPTCGFHRREGNLPILLTGQDVVNPLSFLSARRRRDLREERPPGVLPSLEGCLLEDARRTAPNPDSL